MNGYRTFSDVFNPVDVALKAEQIKNMRQQQEAQRLQNLQLQQQAQKNQAFQQYISGQQQPQISPISPDIQAQQPIQPQIQPQPQQPIVSRGTQPGVQPGVQPQAGIAPQPAPVSNQEQMQIARGQQKLQPIMESAERNANNPNANKINSMIQRDPDMLAAIRSLGFDSVEMGYDESKNKAWQRFTKNWSQDDLDQLSQMPGGQVLQGLPEGKYTIEVDPINKSIRPTLSAGGAQGDLLSEKSLSKAQLIDRSQNHPDLVTRQKASKVLNAMQQYDVNVAQAKYEAVADIPFADWDNDQQESAIITAILESKDPRWGRGDKKSPGQFTRAKNQFMLENRLTPAQAKGKKIRMDALGKTYTRLVQELSDYEKIGMGARNQVERLRPVLDQLQRTNVKLLNIPIEAIKGGVIGSPEEKRAAFLIENAWIDAARIATGSLSNSELTVSTQQRYQETFDPKNSLKTTWALLNDTLNTTDDKLSEVSGQTDSILKQIDGLSLKKDPRKSFVKRNKMPDVSEFKVGSILTTKDGRKFKNTGVSWEPLQ